MILPEGIRGWTFPDVSLGQENTLSVVRGISPGGPIYTAGVMLEGRMDPELAHGWAVEPEVGPGIAFADFFAAPRGMDSARAATAVLACCLEVGLPDPKKIDQVVISDLNKATISALTLAHLRRLGFVENKRVRGLAVLALELSNRISDNHPEIVSRVAIPSTKS